MNKKYFNKRVFVFLLIFGSLLAIQTFAWNNPSQNPPSGAASITADSSGNIGIGMTPTYKLDVTGNSVIGRFIGTGNPEIRVEDSGGSGATAKFGAYENGAGGVLGMVSAHDFRIFTSNAARITIKSGGDVGIGTANPGAKLEVNGQVKITGGTPGSGKVLTSDAAGLGSWQTASGGLSGSGSTNYMAKFTAGTTIGNSQIFDNGTNVSVGTNNPSYNLDIYSTGLGTLRIDGLNNSTVLGGPSPAITFRNRSTVNGNVTGTIWFNNSTNDVTTAIAASTDEASGNGSRKGTIAFFTKSGVAESMRINSSGDVGIGTAGPTQKLDVAGYVKGQSGVCIGNDCRTSWPGGFSVVYDVTYSLSGTNLYAISFNDYTYPFGDTRILIPP